MFFGFFVYFFDLYILVDFCCRIQFDMEEYIDVLDKQLVINQITKSELLHIIYFHKNPKSISIATAGYSKSKCSNTIGFISPI